MSPFPPPTPIPLNQPSSVATTVPVPFELVNAVVFFGCLDKTKLAVLSSTNNAAADPDFLPSEFFCAGEPVLEPGVFECLLLWVGLEYNDSLGLDGVVVDEFPENLDGGVDMREGEFNFVLDWGLGVVRLIEGDFKDDKVEAEGDRERLWGVFLEGVKDATRVLGGVSFFGGSAVCTGFKGSEDSFVGPATEDEWPRTEILRLLTLPGMDVVLVNGGTGVAFKDLDAAFLTVVVPLALDEALGFKVMVDLNALSAFTGLHYT